MLSFGGRRSIALALLVFNAATLWLYSGGGNGEQAPTVAYLEAP